MNAPGSCILGLSGPELTDAEAGFLAEYNPWGMILMGRSCKEPQQLRALIDNIWNALGRACMIFIDQEGGRVRRLRPPHWTDFPAAAVFGELFRIDPELGREACFLGHAMIAAELAELGIHADCTPVLDLRVDGADKIIGDRSFGADPETVGRLGRAALDGMASQGVAGVIKHIPGHGRAGVDSHKELPVITAGRDELETDMAPFIALRDAPMAMVAHIVYQAIDPQAPATLSEIVTGDVIRKHIGFDGLLISDDLEMQALSSSGTLPQRAAATLAAGCDVALCCGSNDTEDMVATMRSVAEVCPPLSQRAAQRAEAAQLAAGTTASAKPDAERFAELLAMVYNA